MSLTVMLSQRVNATSPPNGIVSSGPGCPVLKLGPLIGKGGFAQVFCATDQTTGQLVAVKKSRVSLRVERTLFQHEARVLHILRGHPAIPAVYAIGRFKHFEYLSMELLGQSLGDIRGQSEEVRKEIVPRVAIQMLSALKHMHSYGLIHRDIKPDNILLHPRDHRQIRLIDFGLACLYDRETKSTVKNMEPEFVLGTLAFASLNAHRGLPLGRRDDLESLAYSLFSILRGHLPWEKPHVHSSTPRGVRRRVHAKKQAWSGTRLAEGYDSDAFVRFLDEMRSLGFDEAPSYDRWREVFADVADQRGLSLPFDFAAKDITGDEPLSGISPVSKSATGALPDLLKSKSLPCIVELGQLIYVQLLPRMTIEGYTIGQEDSSGYLDPSLCDEVWLSVPRPAVVLRVWKDWRGKSLIKVAPITRRGCDLLANKVLLTADEESKQSESAVVLGTDWLQDPTWCYSYPHTNTFVCNPDQTEVVPVHWKILEPTLGTLISLLETQPNAVVANEDQYIHGKMMRDDDYFYIKVHSLNPGSLFQTAGGQAVDWASERGWFDELVPIYRRRVVDDERLWTEEGHPRLENIDKKTLSDSYFGHDLTEWRNIQQERDQSLTLNGCLDVECPVLPSIVRVE